MREVILKVLEDQSRNSQINMQAESARLMLAEKLIEALKQLDIYK